MDQNIIVDSAIVNPFIMKSIAIIIINDSDMFANSAIIKLKEKELTITHKFCS